MAFASLLPLPAGADPLDDAFARLAEPSGEGWRIAESDILRGWSRSGSAAMDLLLQRGEAALDMGDLPGAIGHLTALTDHAPDFAAGFQARAAALAMAGQFGPALADLQRTLELEPRHFAALTQLGVMLEEMGDPDRALDAYRASLAIHPHQQEAIDAVARLERQRLGTDI
ncbi:tetratricopeptide repeat protein [Paracoccus liaowanqingii]|uniref:tetratricopeptide repeat protein n=1 Tax=Paracoccus liaowanqingii TaxID=2560053 RepID=UPI001E4EAA85|nr:tetratricopeptide repeat protein [Paracoccus liaowanqingii]